jgi:dihydropteroate synthase
MSGERVRHGVPLQVGSTRAQHAAPLQIGDAGAVVVSILSGAHIVRVHDVAAMLPAIRIADAILGMNKKRS